MKDKRFEIRLSEEELKILRNKARDKETTPSGYIRLLILGETKEYHDKLDKLIYEINKIGTNVNQIAYKLNSTGQYDKTEMKKNTELLEKLLEAAQIRER